MNILVGEISSYKAIVIARYIKRNYKDAVVYTYDKKRRSNYVKSRYSDKHFFVNQKYFEEELQKLIKENNIDFFFPVINNSLSILLKNKKAYGKSLDYVDEMSAYKTLNNKKSLHTLASQLGIKVPVIFKDFEEATPPFVIKPVNLSSAIGVHYVFANEEKTSATYNGTDIFQEFVKGQGVGYSFYAKNGKVLDGYGHRRLSEYPIAGGSSTYRQYYHNNTMHEVASSIIENLNYTGFAMFEFKLTNDNELYLLEVNPRIWGSINQGMVDGNVNYFEGILGSATIDRTQNHKDKKTYIGPLIYVSLLRYLIIFKLKPIANFFSNIFSNKADVNLLSDPMGYISTILRKI